MLNYVKLILLLDFLKRGYSFESTNSGMDWEGKTLSLSNITV